MIVLPEHLHCILTLPKGDADFSSRWGVIKANFSRHTAKSTDRPKQSRSGRKRVIPTGHKWQRRFWEHLVRDETDFRQHVDFIHWNPVKHSWVQHVKDWPHSSFYRYETQGIYPDNGVGTLIFRTSMRFVPYRILPADFSKIAAQNFGPMTLF